MGKVLKGHWLASCRVFLHRHWFALAGMVLSLILASSALALRGYMMAQKVTDEEIARLYPSRLTYDGRGRLIDVARGGGFQWRIPVSLSDVPEEMVLDVIAVEDGHFHEHCGVDWRSVLRAAWQMIRYRRIVSGASTLTMQLVNQFEVTPHRRTILYKLRQCGRALNWEKTHSKREILEEYFNRLPYGGAVVGIQAASQFYFGRPVSELNRSEQLMLVGLPQGPNTYRPDRHPERAVRRRDMVLFMLQRAGRITPDEAAAVKALPVRYRDFSVSAWPHSKDMDFLDYAAAVAQLQPGRSMHTTLWPELQHISRQLLDGQCRHFPDVADGAVVIIETKTGKVRALVGGALNGDPRTWQVNAALAWRSPGSVLKTFIYGEAINGGMIAADTILDDSPLELNGYRPGNADGTFRGRVTAREALADSLNTPAVRLLQRLTVPRMLERMAPLEIFQKNLWNDEKAREETAERTGLTLAIGGLESQLLALTAAYSALGRVRRPAFIETGDMDNDTGLAYWQQGTVHVLLRMLRSHQLPGYRGDAAWKTGTSNGNRDAWCIALTPEWTVGVWMGNKNGTPSLALTGIASAAPLVGALMEYLHQGMPPDWSSQEQGLRTEMVCTETGLAPSPFCGRLQPGVVAAEVPLARCEKCRGKVEVVQDVKLLSPAPGTYRVVNGKVEVVLSAEPDECHYYLNGKYLGIKKNGECLQLGPGKYWLLAWPGQGWRGKNVELDIVAR